MVPERSPESGAQSDPPRAGDAAPLPISSFMLACIRSFHFEDLSGGGLPMDISCGRGGQVEGDAGGDRSGRVLDSSGGYGLSACFVFILADIHASPQLADRRVNECKT